MTNKDVSPRVKPVGQGKPAGPEPARPAAEQLPDEEPVAPATFFLDDDNAPLAGVDLQTGRTVQS